MSSSFLHCPQCDDPVDCAQEDVCLTEREAVKRVQVNTGPDAYACCDLCTTPQACGRDGSCRIENSALEAKRAVRRAAEERAKTDALGETFIHCGECRKTSECAEGDYCTRDAVGNDTYAKMYPPIVAAATKDSNPKDALGIYKVAGSVLPLPVLAELSVAMLEGALKYGRHNYRVIGVRASVYFDATVFRHLFAWWEGEDTDGPSDVSHITKAIASLTVLRDAMIQGNWIDDRPPPSPAGWLDELNAKVKALVERNPAPVAPYYANGARGPGRRLEDEKKD